MTSRSLVRMLRDPVFTACILVSTFCCGSFFGLWLGLTLRCHP